jgi:signal transduction histidine kinase
MEFIRTMVVLNRDIIYFGYGLVFFVLGLAIALQSRAYSRLDLARSLKWLAAFGFSHGLHEWGDLFIPIQANYLSAFTIEILVILHLLLLALSYAFLFEFGVALLWPLGKWRFLRPGASILFSVWLAVSIFIIPALFPEEWHTVSNALARYTIGFPGGLLAAYALRKHTLSRIQPLQVPHIMRVLRFAGVMLALYAVFGGLVTPAIPFFPGNIINSVNFENLLLVPPAVFRSFVGLGLVVSIIRALEVFDLETARRIEAMELQQILNSERDRIARDLHDGAIQKVYTAGLLVESAHKLSETQNPVLAERLNRAENVLDDAIRDLRRNLEELHLRPEAGPFPEALKALVHDPRFGSLVSVDLDLDLPSSEPLSPIRAGHILAIVNEALSNVIRHAKARQVKVTARHQNGRLSLQVIDDGVGVPDDAEGGFGLRNMRDRARLLGGSLKVEQPESGTGARIVLDVPWREDR